MRVIHAIAIVSVLAAGCEKKVVYIDVPVERISVPDQPPMSLADYPEWAKKEWGHLVISQGVEHYYVDMGSFNEQRESYVTIENDTIFLGGARYKIVDRGMVKGMARSDIVWHEMQCDGIQRHFEGDPAGLGWIFPCVRPGRWHAVLDWMGNGDVVADDVAQCRHCDRHYQIGRVEFQVETGNVQWRRR
jgi:hypothetical protein